MDAVREKLIELEKQYNEISDQLISDEVISNPAGRRNAYRRRS